jgi:hypothetical protein
VIPVQKLLFAAAHYAALAVFVASCWGLGRAALGRAGAAGRGDAWLDAGLSVTAGMGIFIGVFQALAIAGRLTPVAVGGAVVLGIGAALLQWPGWLRQARLREAPPALSWIEKAALIALALVAANTLASPLAPPAEWDELMYHLPYAREVARGGSLGIYEWLRYPWFPCNLDLLYAGALTVGGDVFPHLLHALAGWTAAVIVYRHGVLHLDRVTACVGAAIWLRLSDYSSAYIDNGVALFVLAACVALWRWRESPPPGGAGWLALAGFFMGVAAGAKYQALMALPLLGAFALWRERRPRALAAALGCFLIPCAYWYARNAVMTGDPFNPMGGRVFGFTNWNLDDYRRQFEDLHHHAALPSWLLWPALLAPFTGQGRRGAALRAAAVFCAWSVAVWMLTSRFPRYLSIAWPLLALLAGAGWLAIFGGMAAALRKAMPPCARGGALGRAGRWLSALLLVAAAGAVLGQTLRKAGNIAVTPGQREAFLRERVPGYAVMNALRERGAGRVYQAGLDSAIYYGPSPVWGDVFGPWRYADFIDLPPAELAGKLSAQGFDTLALSSPMAARLEARPGFQNHFTLLYEKDDAKAYRIRHGEPANPAR